MSSAEAAASAFYGWDSCGTPHVTVRCNSTCCVYSNGTIVGTCVPVVEPEEPLPPVDGGSGSENPGTGEVNITVPENSTIIIIDENYTSLNESINTLRTEFEAMRADYIEFKARYASERSFLANRIIELQENQENLAQYQYAAALLIQELQQNMTSMSCSTTIDVLEHIQQYGLFVSGRWRIGEEPSSDGKLVIRDLYSTIVEGVDARYSLDVATHVDL